MEALRSSGKTTSVCCSQKSCFWISAPPHSRRTTFGNRPTSSESQQAHLWNEYTQGIIWGSGRKTDPYSAGGTEESFIRDYYGQGVKELLWGHLSPRGPAKQGVRPTLSLKGQEKGVATQPWSCLTGAGALTEEPICCPPTPGRKEPREWMPCLLSPPIRQAPPSVSLVDPNQKPEGRVHRGKPPKRSTRWGGNLEEQTE